MKNYSKSERDLIIKNCKDAEDRVNVRIKKRMLELAGKDIEEYKDGNDALAEEGRI